MTKLMEWLAALTVVTSVWLALVLGKIGGSLITDQPLLVYSLPLLLVGCFGVYAATVVLYRTFTFNTCEDAAIKLHKEIQDARDDLTKQGFLFSQET